MEKGIGSYDDLWGNKLVTPAYTDSVEAEASPSVLKDDWCSLESLVCVTENFGIRVR